jgi:hypothetical protein
MRIILAVLATVFLMVLPALAADIYIPHTSSSGGVTWWTLCDDQTGGTTCTTSTAKDGTGPNNILTHPKAWFWTFCADESDQTTGWTVKIYKKTEGAGYGTVRSDITYLGALTPAAPCIDFSGSSGDIHAVLGGTLTEGVTVTGRGQEP